MIINIDPETKEIVSELKLADGYLDCEKIIIHNIKKQFKNGHSAQSVITYLKELLQYFEELIVKNKDTFDCSNYRYTVGFLDTLTRSKYWHSWITSTNL
jgi:hypothetical protein